MDPPTDTRLLNRVSAPYDFIDTDWVTQRIKDRLPNGRRSKLAAYFDGFMEFTHEPPSLSRSPSPEAERTSRSPVDSSSGQFRPSAKNLGAGWARRQQPRISTRRSTNASNSDPDLGSRKRRNVTPVLRHRQTVDSRIRKRISRAADMKQGQNLHRMETRSKSGRNTHRRSSGSEKAKARRKGA